MASPLPPGLRLSFQDLRDSRGGRIATAGDALDRARSFESLLRPSQQPISAASSLGCGEGAVALPEPPALERLKYEEGVRKTRSHQSLYWPGSELPRPTLVRIRTDDEHRPVRRRKRGSGLVSNCSRSLENLDQSEPVGMCTRSLEDLDQIEPAEIMRWRSPRSLKGLSSEEDLEGMSEDTSGGETTGDELQEYSRQQTRKQAFGAIELVAGPVCDCQSKESCHHHHFWRGIITKSWSMKLFHNDGGSEREIKLPPDTSPLSEENMEAVSKISGATVFEKPF